MIVEGTCRECRTQFNAHWNLYPEGYSVHPYCPSCKGYDVSIWTDESDDYNAEVYYDEEEI